jgi:thiol-disulfide isomerase/thioredoxin
MFTIIIIFIVLIYFFGNKIQKYLQKSTKNIIQDKILTLKKSKSTIKPKKEHYISTNNTNNYTIILCYADWCSHCPFVKEWYNDLVNQSPLSKCVFYAIEEKDLPKDLLNKIPGFPTILIQNEKSIQVYNGERSKTSLLSHLEKL